MNPLWRRGGARLWLWLCGALMALAGSARAEGVALWAIQRGCDAQTDVEVQVRRRLEQMGEEVQRCAPLGTIDLSCRGRACVDQLAPACRGLRVLGGVLEPSALGTRIRLWLSGPGPAQHERLGFCEGCDSARLAEEVAREAAELVQRPEASGLRCGGSSEQAAQVQPRGVLLVINVPRPGRGLGAALKDRVALLGHKVEGVRMGQTCTTAECLHALTGRMRARIDWVVGVDPERSAEDRYAVWGYDLATDKAWQLQADCGDPCTDETRRAALVQALGQVAQRCVGEGCGAVVVRAPTPGEQAACQPPLSLLACRPPPPPPPVVIAPPPAPRPPPGSGRGLRQAGVALTTLGVIGLAGAGVLHGLDGRLREGYCSEGGQTYGRCLYQMDPFYQISYAVGGVALGVGVLSLIVYKVKYESK